MPDLVVGSRSVASFGSKKANQGSVQDRGENEHPLSKQLETHSSRRMDVMVGSDCEGAAYDKGDEPWASTT